MRKPCGEFLDISQFVNDYYIEPIMKHEGYNAVNTLTYAAIAIAAVYAVYLIFQKYKINVDRKFVMNTLPFVLFGSTVRVITDSIDTGVMKPISPVHEFVINSHIYDYGLLSSSPGIYVVTAALFFLSLFIARKLKDGKLMRYIGLALWVPHMLVLLPMFRYSEFLVPVLMLAAIPYYFSLRYFRSGVLAGVVGAHALDGAATFYIIDVFSRLTGKSYFEQHVIPSFIGETFGTFLPFYLLKAAIAFGASYFIAKEKDAGENEKHFIALLLIIIGLAPGVRDLLRMVVGA